MARKNNRRSYSAAEKKSYKKGFFAGLFTQKKRTRKTKNVTTNTKPKKLFGFLAFNENCDVFNVHSEGVNRSDALKNAKKHLKRDPEVPSWGVTVTNDKTSEDFYRHVTVKSSGSVVDSWKPHYRDRDDDTRRKYKDLSVPVKGYKYD